MLNMFYTLFTITICFGTYLISQLVWEKFPKWNKHLIIQILQFENIIVHCTMNSIALFSEKKHKSWTWLSFIFHQNGQRLFAKKIRNVCDKRKGEMVDLRQIWVGLWNKCYIICGKSGVQNKSKVIWLCLPPPRDSIPSLPPADTQRRGHHQAEIQ